MRSSPTLALAGLLCLSVAAASAKRTLKNKDGETVSQDRRGKLMSLFSVVQFENTECVSTSSLSGGSTAYRNGTCYTSSECTDKGGTSNGNCAAGFGVCCVFTASTCGDSVSQNGTYIRNPNFPSAYGATTQCSYTLEKADSDVCFIRLDFESFSILGPLDTLETDGGVCQDTMEITLTGGAPVPTICGPNAGQHIYLDVGGASSSSATIDFTFDGTATGSRNWELKTLQIPCYSPSKPPAGCLQYTTGLTGTFSTFNFQDSTSNLPLQRYTSCIRQEEGYCCIQYQACSDDNAFSLGALDLVPPMSKIDAECTSDYITIDGAAATCYTHTPENQITKFCGNFFGTVADGLENDVVCDCSTPFDISVYTDQMDEAATALGTMGTNAALSRGACLTWMQIPCNGQ